MQRDLVSMLHQEAGSQPLASRCRRSTTICVICWPPSQLLSGPARQRAGSAVQRFAPKLMRSLGARSRFANRRVYGRAQEATRPAHDPAEPIVAEVRRSAGLATDASIMWISAIERGLAIDADPDQLFRVLLNLVRNGAGAGRAAPQRRRQHADPHHRAPRRLGRDIGGFPTPAPACPPRPASICSGLPDHQPARRQRLGAIAAELVRAQ
jgi:hypothetical protein